MKLSATFRKFLIRLVLVLALTYLFGGRVVAVSPDSPDTSDSDDTSPGSPASFILSREQELVQKAELRAHETALVQQAVQKTPAQKNALPEEIRNILLREASLVSAATTPPNVTPRVDRVTYVESMIRNNDYRMALGLLSDIVHSDTATPEERGRAQLLLGQIALHQHRNADAVVELSSWLANFPRRKESPFVYFLLGQCYREMGAYEQARENFYRVLSSSLITANNNDTSVAFTQEKKLVRAAVWQLAETEYERRNWDKALTYFDRFNSQNPSGDQLVEASLYRRSDCLYQLRRNDESVQAYEKAIAIAPFHPFAPEAWLRLYFLYGMADRRQKQADAMQALVWTVNTLQPERLAYWQQRGVGMLLELPSTDNSQLVDLRDALKNRATEDGWKQICAYLDQMADRITLDKAHPPAPTLVTQTDKADAEVPAPPTAGTPQSADEYAKWIEDYTRRREQLQEQTKSWMDRTPVAAPGSSKKKQASKTEG
jgi:tetratricopeptide (TPR) repeat protein